MEEKVKEALNDLIRINNDRIEGYEKAIAELGEDFNAGFKELFLNMIHESQIFKNELSNAVIRLGGEPAKDTTTAGKLYRYWMDFKATFTGGSTKTVLESCEFGEDAAVKAYNQALDQDMSWPANVHEMILNQRQLLKEAHDKIKLYRDSKAEVHNS